MATDPVKVAAVNDWPLPANVSQLQSFLILASYYQCFLRDFATIASPLRELTKRDRLLNGTREGTVFPCWLEHLRG